MQAAFSWVKPMFKVSKVLGNWDLWFDEENKTNGCRSIKKTFLPPKTFVPSLLLLSLFLSKMFPFQLSYSVFHSFCLFLINLAFLFLLNLNCASFLCTFVFFLTFLSRNSDSFASLLFLSFFLLSFVFLFPICWILKFPIALFLFFPSQNYFLFFISCLLFLSCQKSIDRSPTEISTVCQS